MDVLSHFTTPVRRWFTESFAAPTAVQQRGWPAIAGGKHALLLAPTGSGKTLAAFLACLDRLVRLPVDAEHGVRVLYVSPLKALVYDIERNLRAPLVGIANAASLEGHTMRPVRVDIRTGDTPQRDRRMQAKNPGEVLVTTPESLYLILGSNARETLRSVQTVIVDEIHTMAGTKRGVHLALSLERLAELTDGDPQRVGLSATQRPLEEVARYLGGNRPVEVVDTSEPPHLSLEIVVPVVDMENPVVEGGVVGGGGEGAMQAVGGGRPLGADEGDKRLAHGIWPTIYPKLLDLIRSHRSTIVFTNSRLLCERLAKRLNELAGEDLVRAHHGSISHSQRTEVEEQLKRGTLPAIVATSSLELGIDMGAVDLVILVESPGSVASGLQRVGRAGHGVGERSEGRIFPKFRGDLVEATVVAHHMVRGHVEATRVPKNCLDVLAQQIVAMCSIESWTVTELHALVRRTYSYSELRENSLVAVLDMLSGRYPSDDFAELTPRITWDRTTDTLTGRRGAKMLSLLNAGTIPDRGLYSVHLGGEGPRLGELDEEMVYESRRGDLIILGASTWRVEEITRDKVVVSPAPGEPGRLPFWHGERPGRPVELGRAVGEFLGDLVAKSESDSREWLIEHTPLDTLAAGNLVAYIEEQKASAGSVPTDKQLVVEAFRDELGDWRVCILSPFGSRVHAPWAMALEALFSTRAGFEIQTLYTDDGLALRFADIEELPPLGDLFPDPDELEELVVEQLAHSALFASRFRENAARALLLPRRSAKGRTPLWAQRLKSQRLLAVAQRYPAFPIVLETYRECLQDSLDLPALCEVLRQVRSREIAVHEVQTSSPSPFARSLVFAYVAAFMYAGDAPLAERKAQALTLDRDLLRELLGQEELRDLLDPGAVASVESELQWLAADRKARHADGVHDLLRRLGDLSTDEIAVRSEEPPMPWLRELEVSRRVIPVRVAGEERWIAGEDAGRYRDALGVVLPQGLPVAYLATPDAPLESLLLRYSRTHGPFLGVELATRYGLPQGAVDAVLRALEARELLLRGDLRPGGTETEWCDPEVLRRLRRRSLAALRKEVAPVDGDVYARFLMSWHGIGSERGGPGRLAEVVDQLEGVPLPASMLETSILPRRIHGFTHDLLDQLGAMGQVVWIGCGALGPKDGRVALYRRERVAHLLELSELPEGFLDAETSRGALRNTLLEHLEQRGASFMVGLSQAVPDAPLTEVTAALWDLVWAGRVTNDTFGPLRALRSRTKRKTGRGVSRRVGWSAGGRWSAVSELVGPRATDTERAHARASLLLERYGIATSAAAKADGLPGGFNAVYGVLRAMEESGRARRGWFVDGLQGAQFALSGAVDRLRACRGLDDTVVCLAATDPASPWGLLLPWPETSDRGRPRRVVGAAVVLVGGQPVLFVEKGEKRWITFPAADDVSSLRRAIEGWLHSRGDRWRTVRVDRIDGDDAVLHPQAALFEELGFAKGYKGLERART